ncbi:MAG: hypothetical protein IKM61_03425 [Eubacteriaceae bacterium]|nr:hypothetical protein [Eubacteriaceae bacterium]
MKKIILLILSLLLVLPVCSCERDLINNADTGEIILTEKKYSYTDGTYYAGYGYFRPDGTSPAAMVIISDGLIKSIRFDYFNSSADSVLENKDAENPEKINELKSARKALYNQTLSMQSVTGINYTRDDVFTEDYLTLISAILRSASSGGQTTMILPLSGVYEARENITDELTAVMKVSFLSDNISDISFDIISPDGNSIAEDEALCTELFGITPEDFREVRNVLEKLPVDNSLSKTDGDESLEKIFAIYNDLSAQIEKLRIKTDFNFKKLF